MAKFHQVTELRGYELGGDKQNDNISRIELVADHRTGDVVFASPEWTLEHAAAAMVRGNFRHLVVIEDNEVIGLLSMRDIVRCWSGTAVAADREHAAAQA